MNIHKVLFQLKTRVHGQETRFTRAYIVQVIIVSIVFCSLLAYVVSLENEVQALRKDVQGIQGTLVKLTGLTGDL